MSCLREPNSEPIPGYRLIEPLGSGGFGEVWKCEAPGGIFKAIKFVYGNLKALDVEGARAEQELHALQRIKEVRHPFILSLDRIEAPEGELVIVMELADRSLHDHLVECQSTGLVGIPRERLLRFMRDAAEGLDHMNERHNLQHLDIKPRNLFLVSDRVKVADFGLVKHLDRQNSGLGAGVTPLYAPPETFSGKISGSSDQYSLAIVYQELLTGQRPFSGKNARQLAQQHMQAAPDLRALPEAERDVVARALAKDPAQRFPNCLAFVRALYAAQGRRRALAPEEESQEPAAVADALDADLDHFATSGLIIDPPMGENDERSVAALGMTVAQPDSGALRPTVIIGIGSFGRRALRDLRCRFFDRFGDLARIPLIRFLYVDPDPDAVQDALRGDAEVGFSPNEVYHLPLQTVGHYRRRALDHLSDWLPREKLYAMPRSPQPQGSRALGRLAFVDNHHRFLARIRREVQQASHPDTLYQSVTETGLALRDGSPQIYVLAAAGGGSSGSLVDLGYSLRRLMQQLRLPDVDVMLFLFCGAPSDPATSRAEQANIYATLTELNHFADPSIPFAAQYGADAPRVLEEGRAFTSTYLLQLPHRGPDALREAIGQVGSYLFHELSTPLGCYLTRCRHLPQLPENTCFRAFGTYAVWFPRGLFLRLAARRLCAQLIQEWQAGGKPTAIAEVEAGCARALADSDLRPETITLQIEESAKSSMGNAPDEALTNLIASLEEQSLRSVAQEEPGNWASQALDRVLDLAGTGSSHPAERGQAFVCGEWRRSRATRALTEASEVLAEHWDNRLADTALRMTEYPGRRVAASEHAMACFIRFCEDAGTAQRRRWEEQIARTDQAWVQLESVLRVCASDSAGGGGWGITSWLNLGNQTRRSLRLFMDHLAAFGRQCLNEEIQAAVHRFLTSLAGRLNARLADLIFVRQRLEHLREKLECPLDPGHNEPVFEPATADLAGRLSDSDLLWPPTSQSNALRVILPGGEEDIEEAARAFAESISDAQMLELDIALQEGVLGPRGGLRAACVAGGDINRYLSNPLLDQAVAYLGSQLPLTDVAEVGLTTTDQMGDDLSAQIAQCMSRATPLVCGEHNRQHSYLLIPASSAGKALGEKVRAAHPKLKVIRVPGQAHLLFCREQDCLSAEDLPRVFDQCRPAYEAASTVPSISPHARFDIIDWVPLDP